MLFTSMLKQTAQSKTQRGRQLKDRTANLSQYLMDFWQKSELISHSVWVHCHYLNILVWIVDKTLLPVQCILILSSLLSRHPTPPLHTNRGTVAHKIMQKYGFKEGQGLGKHEQGLSTALSVEKTSKRGGKIIIGDAAEKRERRRTSSHQAFLFCLTHLRVWLNLLASLLICVFSSFSSCLCSLSHRCTWLSSWLQSRLCWGARKLRRLASQLIFLSLSPLRSTFWQAFTCSPSCLLHLFIFIHFRSATINRLNWCWMIRSQCSRYMLILLSAAWGWRHLFASCKNPKKA